MKSINHLLMALGALAASVTHPVRYAKSIAQARADQRNADGIARQRQLSRSRMRARLIAQAYYTRCPVTAHLVYRTCIRVTKNLFPNQLKHVQHSTLEGARA